MPRISAEALACVELSSAPVAPEVLLVASVALLVALVVPVVLPSGPKDRTARPAALGRGDG